MDLQEKYSFSRRRISCSLAKAISREKLEKGEILYELYHRFSLYEMCIRDRCISVREMARLISGVSGRGFAPAKDSKALLGTESQSLIFCENSRLTAGYGVARAVREDEQVSGDNFSFQMLDRCV